MKKCECCELKKEIFPDQSEICEDCCNYLILGGTTSVFDWSHYDFEKEKWK